MLSIKIVKRALQQGFSGRSSWLLHNPGLTAMPKGCITAEQIEKYMERRALESPNRANRDLRDLKALYNRGINRDIVKGGVLEPDYLPMGERLKRALEYR